jgi:hypothetical protein
MSTAFAERAVAERGLEGFVARTVTDAELNACDLVATRGCPTPELGADVEIRDWALADPDGQDAEGGGRSASASPTSSTTSRRGSNRPHNGAVISLGPW